MKPHRFRVANLTAMAIAWLGIGLGVNAAQVLTAERDETLVAVVSAHDPTLIRVDGSKIRKVFGAEGDFSVAPDKETGVAYLKPAPGVSTFSVFVTDEEDRTWKLLLTTTDAPSDAIVIKSKGHATITMPGKDTARSQAIKGAVFSLMSADSSVQVANDTIPLWDEALFVRTAMLDTGRLKGERYRLTNISKTEMIIDERELYRRGVLAVAVERPTLRPGEATDIYVVLEGAR